MSCAQEILAQAFQKGIQFDHIVCASGSGGTHAGLLVGLGGMGSRIPVTGICVRRPVDEQERLIGGLRRQNSGLRPVLIGPGRRSPPAL